MDLSEFFFVQKHEQHSVPQDIYFFFLKFRNWLIYSLFQINSFAVGGNLQAEFSFLYLMQDKSV